MQARQIDGNSLTYLVVEPDEFDPQQEYPAVVLLHGFGASMTDLAGLSTMLDRTGYLYFFPNAPISLQIAPGMTGYAWTPPGGQADDHTTERAAERSEELLVGFYDEIEERHGVKDRRHRHGRLLSGRYDDLQVRPSQTRKVSRPRHSERESVQSRGDIRTSARNTGTSPFL